MREPVNPARLIDATLRDGSYCVNFQFTAADTAILVGMLDAAGVGFLEIGHGSGSFNHLAPPHFRSPTRQAVPDEEYFAVARQCAKRAKLGVITGPFGYDNLHVLAEHRIDFVRLACMANRALEVENIRVAERVKSLGMLFSVNLMQTTAISPSRLAEIATEYARVGIDWFYIVDSSGGLLPRAVTEYVSCVQDSGLTIGFHAHHNSGLAVANCLAAIEAGATLVDGTLQGLGRDVGNAPTEQLLFLLQRLGHERAIDVEQVSYAGDLVRRLLEEKGDDPTYFAAGASEIHSSNVEALEQLARDKGLGRRSLIAAVGHGPIKLIGAGMKTFPDDVIGPACVLAMPDVDPSPSREVVNAIANDITRASTRRLAVLADVLFARAAKQHARAVMHLVPASQLLFDGPLPWHIDGLCGITVGVDAAEVAGIDFGDRAPIVIVVDPELATSFPHAMADAFAPTLVDATLTVASVTARQGSRAYVACTNAALAAQLAARGANLVTPATLPAISATDVVVVVDRDVPPEIADLARRGVRLLRPFLAKTIAARIAMLLDLHARLHAGNTGALVDPLFVPTGDQCVVDDPACPTTVVDHANREGIAAAASARAKSLVRGRGQL